MGLGMEMGTSDIKERKELNSSMKTDKKAQLSLTNPRNAVEIRVMGHSRASKVPPFNSSPMVSY